MLCLELTKSPWRPRPTDTVLVSDMESLQTLQNKLAVGGRWH